MSDASPCPSSPFDLLTEGKPGFSHQNVMCTFFLAILVLICYERITGKDPTPVRTGLGAALMVAGMAAALLLRTDYNFYGMVLEFANQTVVRLV